MRVVNFETFRSLPDGTLFLKYDNGSFGELYVKGPTLETDYVSAPLTGNVMSVDTSSFFDALERMEKGSSEPLDFDGYGRDGLFELHQMYAVYELADIEAFIFKLHECRQLGYLLPQKEIQEQCPSSN